MENLIRVILTLTGFSLGIVTDLYLSGPVDLYHELDTISWNTSKVCKFDSQELVTRCYKFFKLKPTSNIVNSTGENANEQ